MSRKKLGAIAWEELPDEALLKTRIRDLKLHIEGTVLEDRMQRLYAELQEKCLRFRPPCYLADEWLTPDGIPIIGIPFYLAHPRLTHLEKKMMLEAEGETDAWCMKLLRHETGHVINYAYRLYSRTRWRALFGPYSTRYTSAYSAQPYSKRFVNHLEDNYAQAHPDEDFAETFAVWLTPHSNWKEKYRGWPALKKLSYVDHIAKSIGEKLPLVTTHSTPWSAARMRSTLAAYYDRKRRLLGDDFPGFYDPALQRIFTTRQGEDPVKASHFMRVVRRHVVNSVSLWTAQRKFDIDKLMRKLAMRCDGLNLYLSKTEKDTVYDVTAFITAAMARMRPESLQQQDK